MRTRETAQRAFDGVDGLAKIIGTLMEQLDDLKIAAHQNQEVLMGRYLARERELERLHEDIQKRMYEFEIRFDQAGIPPTVVKPKPYDDAAWWHSLTQ